MSITKVVEYYDSETGAILKEEVFEVKDMMVKFKVGSGNGNVASRFSKVFHLEDPKFDKASYYQYFYKCLLQLEMSTNRLVVFTDKLSMNEPLDEKGLSVLLDCSVKTVSRFLEHCIEKGIIARFDKNRELYGYIVNPIYALNGSKITSTLYTMFNTEGCLDKHIPQQDLTKLKEYLKLKPLLDTCDLN